MVDFYVMSHSSFVTLAGHCVIAAISIVFL